MVETSSGVSAFVLAYWLGPGRHSHGGAVHRPHNLPFVLLGAGLLFIGWYGFNAGSAVAANYIAGRAFANTHLAASAALGVWGLCEIVWGDRRRGWFKGTPTALGAATGAVVGLVGITPACGFVSQMDALLIGTLCAIASYWAVQGLKKSGVDDRLECLPCHGVAGALGIILTGLFASKNEGSPSDGAFYGNPAQLGSQLLGLLVTVTLCVVGTTIAYFIVRLISRIIKVPLVIPMDQQGDVDGSTHGETAYWNGSGDGYVPIKTPREMSESDVLIGALDRSSALLVNGTVELMSPSGIN